MGRECLRGDSGGRLRELGKTPSSRRSRILSLALLGGLGILGADCQPAAPPEPAAEPTLYPSMGSIDRKHPRLGELVPEDARLERLASGFEWSEGPVWVWQEGYLLFSDIPRNTIFKWQENQGVSPFLHPSGFQGENPPMREPGSNGLTLDRQGRLVICEHGDRRITRLEADGTRTVLVCGYEGKRLNSPNDLVFKSNGDLYFTDPPYGLTRGNEDPEKELDFNGVFRLSPDGTLTLLTAEMTRPNGIAFSPDEKILYVANSDPQRAVWMAYEVGEDGLLSTPRVLFDATSWTEAEKGLPDGMAVDQSGNLFATGPGGVWVFAPDGTHLGTLRTGEATANCTWGEDGSTLFITADMYLCRIRLSTRGYIPFHLTGGR